MGTQCKTEYEELCETTDKQKCHTDQVKVHHHHEQPRHQKWKRSSEEGDSEDEEVEDMGKEEEGVAEVEGAGVADDDGGSRKERSLERLGLSWPLKKKAPLKHHKSHKAVHHKVKHETVCTH